MKDLLLILASLLGAVALIPYTIDTFKSKTKPNITSWVTWTILIAIVTGAEIASGEYRVAIFTGASFVSALTIVILGLKNGHVAYSKLDTIAQIGALCGFALWVVFNSPLTAIVSSIVIDFIAGMPTLKHLWHKPNEETVLTFALSGCAAFLALLSLKEHGWSSSTFLVYAVAINTVFVVIALLRGRLLMRSQS